MVTSTRTLLESFLSDRPTNDLTVTAKGLSYRLVFDTTDPPQAATTRFVLQVRDAPLPASTATSPTLHGSAMILGDDPVALALHQQLTELGATCHQLPVDAAPRHITDAMDRIWQDGPAPHLFLTTPRCDEAALDSTSPEAWQQRRSDGVLLPFVVCKHWLTRVQDAGLEQQATLVAATALGGDFGLAGRSAAFEGAALQGLLKALHFETDRRLRTLTVDSLSREPAALTAKQLIREFAADLPDFEVGYIRGSRYLLCAIPQSTPPPTIQKIKPGSVWIVTGGTRPPVAALLSELGKRWNIRFHLLEPQSTPHANPNGKARTPSEWSTLKTQAARQARNEGRSALEAIDTIEKQRQREQALLAFHAAGVDAAIHHCDPADAQTVQRVLTEIRTTVGPISGILHAAGDESFGAVGRKDAQQLSSVLHEKVDPAFTLAAATRNDAIEHLVALCSSEATLNGSLLADWAIAGTLLAQFVASFKQTHPDCSTRVVHAPLWEAPDHPQRANRQWVFDQLGIQPLPLDEGVDILTTELTAASHETHTLFLHHPGGFHSDQPILPDAYCWHDAVRRAELVSQTPLIDAVHVGTDGAATAYLTFDPRHDPFVSGHRDKSSRPGESIPMLPAVVSIEACAQAVSVVTGFRHVAEIRDVKLLNGFRMANPAPHRARVRLDVSDNAINCRFSGDFHDSQGRLTDPDRSYLTCTLIMSDSSQQLAPTDDARPPQEWLELFYEPRTAIDDRLGVYGCQVVDYGPELRCLKQIVFEDARSWGIVQAPPVEQLGGARRGHAWITSPAFMDAVLATCGLLLTHVYKAPQLPYTFQQIEFGRPPRTGERCLVRADFRGRDGRRYSFDFQVTGDDGEMLVSCRQFDFIGLGT